VCCLVDSTTLITPPDTQVVPTKGSIAIAIPSGSVVKALGGLKGVAGVDWSKVRAAQGCSCPEPHVGAEHLLLLTDNPPALRPRTCTCSRHQVHVFFCNERDGGKTYSGDKSDFLDVVGIPAGNCHPVTGLDNGGDPKAAAAAYEKLLLTSSVISKSNDGPCFDWIGTSRAPPGLSAAH
jgi:hypothetical protein